MEIKSDYFNRVRMNTIQSKQVFCPIPFTEYHPAIIYGDKRPPTSMVKGLKSINDSLTSNLGFQHDSWTFWRTQQRTRELLQDWLPQGKDVLSLMTSLDSLQARASLSKQVIKHESELEEERREKEETMDNLCLVLRQVNSLHTLRAPDPSLMLRYEEVTCDNM